MKPWFIGWVKLLIRQEWNTGWYTAAWKHFAFKHFLTSSWKLLRKNRIGCLFVVHLIPLFLLFQIHPSFKFSSFASAWDSSPSWSKSGSLPFQPPRERSIGCSRAVTVVQLSLSVLNACSFPDGKMPPAPNGGFDFRRRYLRVSMFRQENASITEGWWALEEGMWPGTAGGARTGHPPWWGGAGLPDERKRAKTTERRDQAGCSSAVKCSLPRRRGWGWGAEGRPSQLTWQVRARILRKGLLSPAQRETSRQPEYDFIPFKSEFSAACVVGNGPVPPAKLAAGSELWLVAAVCGSKP